MDVLRLGGLRVSPLRLFDHKLEIRAEKYERLRGGTNVTSCRSPARDDGSAQFTHRLKERRQAEFLKRRSLSPLNFKKTGRGSSSPETFSGSSCSPHSSLNTNYRMTTTTMMMMMKEDEASSSLGDVIVESGTHETKQSANTSREEASVQTESGLVTVKESDVLQLQEYLQEALWREEAIKKKLEESTAQFLNSSNIIWKARCNEEVLRNRIKVLEVQLQACLQKFPKDATRKLVLQMKKQKVMYGEKTHKVTEEKHEAGEALITAKVDVLKMQSLYEELKLTSENLRQQQDLRTDQLRQQQVQIELSRCREAALTEELESQRQDMKELQFSMGLLEEYNQFLRDKQQSRGNVEKKDAMVQKSFEEEVKPEGVVVVERTLEEKGEKEEISKKNVDLEEQLFCTQEELRFKEKEFELLQTEFHTMEQEFQSSQTRLSMCRKEVLQASQRCDRPKRRVFWWNPFTMLVFFFLLLLVGGGVILLWLQHPPFREQVVDVYSHMEKQLEEHLMLRTSPKRPGCFRPF
ncbi:uncharacterized protein LOC133554815 isoform X2 [Nerophis ophidion]|uniref:uncharacterized protein LOC133554815 isoform X2 n=1 Tax=Nerophis ophidion TaxID=159077 RepID=UPI002ADF203B|nr:uncharacterized protein LOC133554815 isoform X2 [Nerophis ophidion]